MRVHAAVRFNRYRTREWISLPWSGSAYFAALDWPFARHWMRAVNLSRHHWFKTMQVTSTNVTLRVRPWDLGAWHCRINRIHHKIGKIATLMLFLGPLGSDEEWKLISNFWERKVFAKGSLYAEWCLQYIQYQYTGTCILHPCLSLSNIDGKVVFSIHGASGTPRLAVGDNQVKIFFCFWYFHFATLIHFVHVFSCVQCKAVLASGAGRSEPTEPWSSFQEDRIADAAGLHFLPSKESRGPLQNFATSDDGLDSSRLEELLSSAHVT